MRCVVLLLLAVPVAAQDSDPIKETASQLERAFKSNDLAAVEAALARAEALRKSHGDQRFAPVATAIGKGVRHKDVGIALAAVEALGKLRQKDSGRYLGALLAPPAKPREERLGLHLAAIRAAGSILDTSSLPRLLRLLDHNWTEIATEAAVALGHYHVLEDRQRVALVRRLLPALKKLERTERTTHKETVRTHTAQVRRALVLSLRKLTGEKKLETAADGYAWLKRPLGL